MYFVHDQRVHRALCGPRCPWYHECAAVADREHFVVLVKGGNQSCGVEFNHTAQEQVDVAATYQPNVDHVSSVSSLGVFLMLILVLLGFRYVPLCHFPCSTCG